MKKKAGAIILICAFLMTLAFASAADINQTKLDEAYKWLESEVGDCTSLSVQEIALTLLADPAQDTIDDCKKALLAEKSDEGCFPEDDCTLKDTALALLALFYLEEDTTDYELWLFDQKRVSKDMIWYLEQDSEEAVNCTIYYGDEDYMIKVGEDKKIAETNLGTCLSITSSKYWLEIDDSCYEEKFVVNCNKPFISTLLYKNDDPDDETIFVLSNTQSAPKDDNISLEIGTRCFGTSSDCDYEGSAWTTYALKEENEVEEFFPYLLATADANEDYFPTALISLVTGRSDYETSLIKDQNSEGYWEAEGTVYGRYYDTALALLALPDSIAGQVDIAREWLMSEQEDDGSWNSIRDTAMILWAMGDGHKDKDDHTINPTPDCEEADFFCISKSDCEDDEVLDNYFCSGTSKICCETTDMEACDEMGGEFCTSKEYCDGQVKKASDGSKCCLSTCKKNEEPEPNPEQSECEENGYKCRSKCSDTQEEADHECDDAGDVCCKTKSTPEPGISLWIWILIIGIVILSVVIFLMRDRLKLLMFKKKSGSQGGPQTPFSMFPPNKPGFPPVRRMPPRPPARPVRRDRGMDDTFKKLKDMTK